MLKRCKKCGQPGKFYAFNRACCKDCLKKKLRAWRRANPGKVKAQKTRYKTNPINQSKIQEGYKLDWADPIKKARYQENHRKRRADPIKRKHDLAQKMRYEYEIELEEIDKLFEKQRGCCAVLSTVRRQTLHRTQPQDWTCAWTDLQTRQLWYRLRF